MPDSSNDSYRERLRLTAPGRYTSSSVPAPMSAPAAFQTIIIKIEYMSLADRPAHAIELVKNTC